MSEKDFIFFDLLMDLPSISHGHPTCEVLWLVIEPKWFSGVYLEVNKYL
jgi:hypothetical protein